MVEIKKVTGKNIFAVYDKGTEIANCNYIFTENTLHILLINMEKIDKFVIDGLIRATVNFAAMTMDMRYFILMDSLDAQIKAILPEIGMDCMEKIDIEEFFAKKNCKV